MGFSHRLGVQYKGFWKPPPVVSGGAPAFSPTDIAGLQLWLDFSDITTLYTDSGKTTPVTADGDVIGCAADKSGNGKDATQGTTGSKPTYKVNIKNGLSVARLDGSDDFLVNSYDSSDVSDYTIFWIFDTSDTSTYNPLYWDTDGAFYIGHSTNQTKYGWYDTAWRYLGNSTTGWQIIAFDLTATTGEGFKNTVSLGTASYAKKRIYANDRFFDRDSGGYVWALDCGELLIWNTGLTGDDYTNLWSYFNTKWSVY